jgi:O-antigen chain-terminating methyltransferase
VPDNTKLTRYVREVARRATGGTPDASLDAAAEPDASRWSTLADPGVRHHLDVAAAHSHLGTDAASGGRMHAARVGMATALRPVLSWQIRFNEELLGAVAGLAEEVEQREHGYRAALATAEAVIDRLEGAAADVELRQRRADEQQRRIEQLSVELQAAHAEIREMRGRLDATLYAARVALPADAAPARLQMLSRELDPSHAALYLDLENTFRGTREAVRALAEDYLPDLAEAGGPVLDIGSGRNEWLELLHEHGIEARGVDTNEAFVADAHARGLDAVQADALEYLNSVPDGSLGAVTAFHVAEHLDLESLLALLGRAARALRPGGLLLLETPNPTNIRVGASAFYIDPTHLKPLHPQFLEFLVLREGFVSAEVRYVHPTDLHDVELPVPEDASPRVHSALGELRWALFGPQDYAVLARTARSRSA